MRSDWSDLSHDTTPLADDNYLLFIFSNITKNQFVFILYECLLFINQSSYINRNLIICTNIKLYIRRENSLCTNRLCNSIFNACFPAYWEF